MAAEPWHSCSCWLPEDCVSSSGVSMERARDPQEVAPDPIIDSLKLVRKEPFWASAHAQGSRMRSLAWQGHARVTCGALPSLHGHHLALTFQNRGGLALGPSSVSGEKTASLPPPPPYRPKNYLCILSGF